MNRAAREVDEACVVYIYGVTDRSSTQDTKLPAVEGITPEAAVSVVAEGKLAAFISLVPAERFGPDGMRSSLEDVEWLRARVIAHEKALEALMRGRNLVPFRLGIVCRDIAKTKELLRVHGEALKHALDRVHGASEWGVKLQCDAGVLRQRIEQTSAEVRKAVEASKAASPGITFFLQKKLEKTIADETASFVKSCSDKSHARLADCAREATLSSFDATPLSSGSVETIFNAAYLIADEKQSAFRNCFAALQDEFAEHGIRCELSGPWPAYHFVSLDADGGADGLPGGK